jgi:hypothetical protein
MADAFPWLTDKGKRAMGVGYKTANQKPVSTPAPKPVAKLAPAPAPAVTPAPAAPPAARMAFDAPATIDFGDVTADPRQKKGSMRRTLLAGETGGFNPATGGSTLGGMRSLLG